MEALILYLVLFFPGILGVLSWFSSDWLAQGMEAAQTLPFSIFRELGRTLTYTLPAIALLLFLISRGEGRQTVPGKKSFSSLKKVTPNKRDILPFLIGLPVLIIIGLFISFIMTRFVTVTPPPGIEGPYNFWGWLVVVLACLGTGYLEELYFRQYLLSRMEPAIPRTAVRVLFSTALFALCHIHYGPWGVLNAAIAGLFLSALFLKFRSLHGVALAHAGYNMFVYFMGTVG